MHSPAPDRLLRGVATQLEAQVLPELGSGAAQRQLKASLHVLRRLERCWDRLPAYLAQDAEDMLRTLSALDLADAALRDRLADAARRKARLDELGWAAPVAELVALHDDLQGCVAEAGRDGDLRPLYHRMLEREAHAWGTS